MRRLIDEINEFTVEATGNPRIRELLTVETDSHSELVAGKARYLGASSMWAWCFAKMHDAAERHDWTRFISMHDQYSLLAREEEREMFGLLADQGVGSIPWSPLAAGKLTRPWGQRGSARSQANPSVDTFGRPLWLDSDEAIVDVVARIAQQTQERQATRVLSIALDELSGGGPASECAF